jgi:hypothetical protein
MGAGSSDLYPRWRYFPAWEPPAPWVEPLVGAVAGARDQVDSTVQNYESNEVLARMAPGMEGLGYQVERGKRRDEKLFRPVFFGEAGAHSKSYDIDAYHPEDRVAVEVEAGRSIVNNAIYKDLVVMCLMADVDFGAVAVPLAYRKGSPYLGAVRAFEPIFASPRFNMPLKGFLVLGY